MINEFLAWYARPQPGQVERRIVELVRHAWENVPFYRDKMQSAGVSPAAIRNLDDYIHKFPATTAAEYRECQQVGNSATLIDKRVRLDSLVEDRSSGSSGMPVSVYRSPAEYNKNRARALWYLVKAGMRPWHRILAVLPPSQMSGRVSILQCFGFFQRTTVNYTMPIESIVDIILQKRINVIYGQKSFIRLIAEHFTDHHIDPPQLDVLNVGAERVDSYDREYLVKVFQPRRFSEFYGAVEPYLIAAKFNGDYEVDYKAVFFSLRNQEQSGDVTRGDLLVTSLINEAQPILKLDLGDRVAVRHYDRLRNLESTIAKVEGRSNDYLHLPGGGRISGATFYASLEYLSCMRQFKILQERENDCLIMLRLTDQRAENRAQVEAILDRLLGGRIAYRTAYVDTIPIEPNGKFKILTSRGGRSVSCARMDTATPVEGFDGPSH
jgi:phenylacetate-CoA ligase